MAKPVWTWRYNVDQYKNLRNLMVYSIRSNHDQDLKNMIEKIFGTMGLSGSREQEKALITLVRRKADKVVWLARGTLSPPKAKDQSVDVNTFPAVDFSQLANVDGEMTSIDA